MELLTAAICMEYQKRLAMMKKCKTCTEVNFKKLGKELAERCGITDAEALDILNKRNIDVILKNYREGNK